MIVMKVPITEMTLIAIFPLISLFFISLGIGLILATVNIFFRDMEHLYSVILLVIMYMSAIFYSADIINAKYIFVLKFNPIFPVISVFRDCILYGKITGSDNWVLCVVYPVIAMAIGLIAFYKNQDKFILHI
jgi:ABC-2 type transport system permease protein/lipopolysaccharide transport system permease protein